MMHRTVAEVMTRDVATASPEASLKTVAWSLAYNEVSALPVVDTHHHPIGIVSEADLPEAEGRDQLRGTAAVNHRTMDARTAGDLMSTPVLTARPAWSIVETARFLNERGVKRLPVIDDTGTLVGIVSRSDLLRPMLRRDDAIHEEIVDEVLGRTLRMTPGGVTVTVQEGVVTLSGRVEERSTIPIIELLCLSVDGVVSVDHSLEYAVDDLPPDLDPARDAGNP
ncbi:CBS domain-containing protein [Streptomyces sp. NBC_01224]|uniref:CBS domain-containing protein n=1 Tax=Streptomyces sp. NBC_01224 TaxID=2903783 RepID=UPI002E0FBD97|nr:CBS domain-containing protein [Streptomyces sp. NBC_01224]